MTPNSPTPVNGITLPPPSYFDLPRKFTAYRPHQSTAILRGWMSPARFVAQSAPVGFGKSLNAVLQSILLGKRTVILTATKGLQDQYHREFSTLGLVDQRGRDNYLYIGDIDHNGRSTTGDTCESGPCMGGIFCAYKNKGCLYDAAVMQFNTARLAVTNYAWWLAVARNPGVVTPEMLVCDEAHDAPAQLENALAFELHDGDIRKYLTQPPLDPPHGEYFVPADWAAWARGEGVRLTEWATELTTTGQARRDVPLYRAVKRLGQHLTRLATAGPTVPWVWERVEVGRVWKFAPLHPAQFAEAELFRGVGRVLLTSGTLTTKTLTQLGLHPRNTDYQDYPSPFDPQRAPIVLLDTGIRNTRDISDAELESLVGTIDNIIGARLDRKGIIHSVSYARQEWILAHSRYAHLMHANRRKVRGNHHHNTTPTSTAAVVAKFKAAPPPAILVSPSVTTGWDFPGAECEYQILPKLPFPDCSGRIAKARAKMDPEAVTHACAVELQQMCGRGMRGEADRCETLILDASGRWFFGSGNRGMFNAAFWQFFRWGRPGECPPPPPKL